MKTIKKVFLASFTASILGLSSCGPDDTPEPKDYPINDFIFNTFLFAEGTWWAFYDSTTGEYDTLRVTYNVGQHQNVYEGSTFKYSRYFYQAEWIWSKTDKLYFIEYLSDNNFDWNGRTISQIGMNGHGNSYGTGYDILFFDNTLLKDTMTAGYAYKFSTLVYSYFTLNERGDSLYYQNKWNISSFVRYTIINSVANDLNDITLVFQENKGLVSHNIDGNYTLVDQYLLPMIK